MSLNYVTANGLRFAYFEEGEGPLVLLLHGFPDTPHTWDAVRPALAADGFRVVSPFMRGYHPTEAPDVEDYGSDTLGRDALALIGALGEEQAVIVGHDWGASAAYSAAGLAPGKLRALVTVAIPHPAKIRPTPRLLWGVRHFFSLRRRGAADRVRKDDYAMIDTLVHGITRMPAIDDKIRLLRYFNLLKGDLPGCNFQEVVLKRQKKVPCLVHELRCLVDSKEICP